MEITKAEQITETVLINHSNSGLKVTRARRFKFAATYGVETSTNLSHLLKTADVSMSGIFIKTGKKLDIEKDSVCSISLKLTDSTITFTAKAVRLTRKGVGFEIEDIDLGNKRKLVGLVRYLYSQEENYSRSIEIKTA